MSQWALLNQNARGLAALPENGSDPARADSSGETVVHYAAKTNVPVYFEVLLYNHPSTEPSGGRS